MRADARTDHHSRPLHCVRAPLHAFLVSHFAGSRSSTLCAQATRCFCSHSWSSHAWYETSSKRCRCRVDGCRCTCFSYIPGRGSTHLRCSCKHTHEEHRTSDGRAAPCSHPGCGCSGFHSSWRCGSCGEDYDAHFTLFETAKERAACGKPVEANLGGWSDEKPHLDAVCGGVTRMSSLLSGVERTGLVANLPHTDGGAGTRGDGLVSEVVVPAALSSTAAVFANYDRKADAHVAKLKKAREASEARKFASGTHGHKLGGTPPQLAAAVLMGPAPPAGSARAAVGQRPAAPPKSATAAPPKSATAAPPKSAITVAGGVTVARDGASVQPQPPRGPPPGAMRPAAGGGGVGRPHVNGKAAMRILAASAAEARVQAMAVAEAGDHVCGECEAVDNATTSASASGRAAPNAPSSSAASARPSALPARRNAPATSAKAMPVAGGRVGGGGAKVGGAGARGAAKTAVAAVRRERAAEAAERRMQEAMAA